MSPLRYCPLLGGFDSLLTRRKGRCVLLTQVIVDKCLGERDDMIVCENEKQLP